MSTFHQASNWFSMLNTVSRTLATHSSHWKMMLSLELDCSSSIDLFCYSLVVGRSTRIFIVEGQEFSFETFQYSQSFLIENLLMPLFPSQAASLTALAKLAALESFSFQPGYSAIHKAKRLFFHDQGLKSPSKLQYHKWADIRTFPSKPKNLTNMFDLVHMSALTLPDDGIAYGL